jgi:hypothetical protein
MKKLKFLLLATIAVAMSDAGLNAAVMTKQLVIEFNGTVSGTTYTLGAGEVVNNGTFLANGAATVTGGLADLGGGTSGFYYNTTLTNLRLGNWVAEAWVDFDTFPSQGTFIGVEGDAQFIVSLDQTILRAQYWDGTTSGLLTSAKPAANTLQHYALVWDGANTSMTAYVNGVSIGVMNNNTYAIPDAGFIAFGYEHRVNGRGIDGQLSAVAFSTFTGTFDPNSNFAIPEPSSFAISSGLLIMVLGYRRRQSCMA